jgi:hypothetical protein
LPRRQRRKDEFHARCGYWKPEGRIISHYCALPTAECPERASLAT